jgi:hypothetical protein
MVTAALQTLLCINADPKRIVPVRDVPKELEGFIDRHVDRAQQLTLRPA